MNLVMIFREVSHIPFNYIRYSKGDVCLFPFLAQLTVALPSGLGRVGRLVHEVGRAAAGEAAVGQVDARGHRVALLLAVRRAGLLCNNDQLARLSPDQLYPQ